MEYEVTFDYMFITTGSNNLPDAFEAYFSYGNSKNNQLLIYFDQYNEQVEQTLRPSVYADRMLRISHARGMDTPLYEDAYIALYEDKSFVSSVKEYDEQGGKIGVFYYGSYEKTFVDGNYGYKFTITNK